ncbi:MAG: TlpA family protein disulfide reductase [Bacteroides sp.]|nr:TlpA family protein disulfide reductase [Bacteroides sp.]
MSEIWRNHNVKFAVTDPLKNHSHEIELKNGQFEMSVPMRGFMEDIYLYIDATITLPVNAGDTITLAIGDDDMTLSSTDPKKNLDLQLAYTLHKKMRRRYMEINHTYNNFHKLSQNGTHLTPETDSLFYDLIDRIHKYHQRYETVVDTFIANHGELHNEEYFRISSYFSPLKFAAFCHGLPFINSTVRLSGAQPAVDYTSYNESWLSYPCYRGFTKEYLNMAANDAADTFKGGSSKDLMIRKYELRRAMAPTPLLADLVNMFELYSVIRYPGPDVARKDFANIYNLIETGSIRETVSKFIPDIEKILPGKPAPTLTLVDSDGTSKTLVDFKGKFVYLDFWDFGCAPCMREFTVMPMFKEHFADILDKVEIITVCASNPGKQKFTDFTQKHGMDDLNMKIDSKRSDNCYRELVFPSYILIDPDGNIVEFNTMRPSQILRAAKNGERTIFEKAIRER